MTQPILPIIQGLTIPFLGTVLGAACVFFIRGQMKQNLKRGLLAFAAGVMVAASVWSLLLPAISASEHLGKLSFAPAAVGFWAGILFLYILDKITPHLHLGSQTPEGPRAKLKRTTMLTLAVTLHNLPEGMAVGIVFAGWLSGNVAITLSAAFALSIGIAIQNFPEGAIISMPLHAENKSKIRSFAGGVLSGIVEPIAALITIFLADLIIPVMPYMLSFAAGAMIYVVVEELIPEIHEGDHSNIGVIMFSIGFTIMMALDVALG
ncbi:MAG: ZIP family metal transporter [Ruminococcus sp.]|nr:ZIP family metal transporter [Ruminococcus sp.]